MGHSHKHTDSNWTAFTLNTSHSFMRQGAALSDESQDPARITHRLGFQSKWLPIALTIGPSSLW